MSAYISFKFLFLTSFFVNYCTIIGLLWPLSASLCSMPECWISDFNQNKSFFYWRQQLIFIRHAFDDLALQLFDNNVTSPFFVLWALILATRDWLLDLISLLYVFEKWNKKSKCNEIYQSQRIHLSMNCIVKNS